MTVHSFSNMVLTSSGVLKPVAKSARTIIFPPFEFVPLPEFLYSRLSVLAVLAFG